MIKICPYCGSLIQEDATKCPYCKKSLVKKVEKAEVGIQKPVKMVAKRTPSLYEKIGIQREVQKSWAQKMSLFYISFFPGSLLIFFALILFVKDLIKKSELRKYYSYSLEPEHKFVHIFAPTAELACRAIIQSNEDIGDILKHRLMEATKDSPPSSPQRAVAKGINEMKSEFDLISVQLFDISAGSLAASLARCEIKYSTTIGGKPLSSGTMYYYVVKDIPSNKWTYEASLDDLSSSSANFAIEHLNKKIRDFIRQNPENYEEVLGFIKEVKNKSIFGPQLPAVFDELEKTVITYKNQKELEREYGRVRKEKDEKLKVIAKQIAELEVKLDSASELKLEEIDKLIMNLEKSIYEIKVYLRDKGFPQSELEELEYEFNRLEEIKQKFNRIRRDAEQENGILAELNQLEQIIAKAEVEQITNFLIRRLDNIKNRVLAQGIKNRKIQEKLDILYKICFTKIKEKPLNSISGMEDELTGIQSSLTTEQDLPNLEKYVSSLQKIASRLQGLEKDIDRLQVDDSEIKEKIKLLSDKLTLTNKAITESIHKTLNLKLKETEKILAQENGWGNIKSIEENLAELERLGHKYTIIEPAYFERINALQGRIEHLKLNNIKNLYGTAKIYTPGLAVNVGRLYNVFFYCPKLRGELKAKTKLLEEAAQETPQYKKCKSDLEKEREKLKDVWYKVEITGFEMKPYDLQDGSFNVIYPQAKLRPSRDPFFESEIANWKYCETNNGVGNDMGNNLFIYFSDKKYTYLILLQNANWLLSNYSYSNFFNFKLYSPKESAVSIERANKDNNLSLYFIFKLTGDIVCIEYSKDSYIYTFPKAQEYELVITTRKNKEFLCFGKRKKRVKDEDVELHLVCDEGALKRIK